MNKAALRHMEEWKEAILQMLLEFGLIALRDEDSSSCRTAQTAGPGNAPVDGTGQMLLPGIAEPRWWEV